MKTKLLYITIISLLFILQACKRTEPDCGDLSDVITNYNIPDSNKVKIPYIGKDTLVFISDAGDTATLIGQGIKSHYDIITYILGGGDCPRRGVRNYERIETPFLSSNNNLQSLNFISYMDSQTQTPLLTTIDVYSNDINIASSSYEYIYHKIIPDDSIYMNNKFITGNFLNLNRTVLVNKKIGIIKFRDISSKIWILINKK